MSQHFHYVLKNFKDDFQNFSEDFRKFCEEKKIPENKVFEMELSLEELIVNSFSHGNKNGPVKVSATLKENNLQVVIKDYAPPFNLLRDAPEPPEGALADRKVGGLGIHLVKNLNDKVEYAGSREGNTVTLTKCL